MAIEFVQYDDFYTTTNSQTVANDTALNTTTGNFIVVIVMAYRYTDGSTVVTGVADTAGNTYVKAVGEYYNNDNTQSRSEIWYAENIDGNANNITTATFTGADADYLYISVAEFSGVATSSSLLDTSFLSTSTPTTSHNSGNATSINTGDLIIGGFKQNYIATNTTVGSGFTTLTSDLTSVFQIAEYNILGAAGDYDADCTTADNVDRGIFTCAIFSIAAEVGTNISINIADTFKDVDSLQINIGDVWKDVVEVQQNIGDVWKTVF